MDNQGSIRSRNAYLQTFRLERHRNHYLETSYQAHLLSSLVSILPALQPCWVQGKTYRACCPVMCQKNRATHATQAIKNNAQLPSDKTCYVAWTSSSQSEAELACIWCLSSDTFRLERHRNHHLETSYQVHLLSSLVLILPALQCNHVGFKEKPTERLARSCAKRIVQLMLPKPSK